MLNARKPARRIAFVASMSAGLLLSSAVSATADDPPGGGAEQCAPNVICVDVTSGGKTPAPGGSKPGGGGGGSSTGPQLCGYHEVSWACHDPELGWFSNEKGCYYRPLDNPPAAGDPAWGGHDPKDGTLYTKVCPQTGGGMGGAEIVFEAGSPDGQNVNAEATAIQSAYDRVRFKAPVGRAAPQRTAVVNAPVWLWADGAALPTPGSASVAGISVTATPRLVKADWSFGDHLQTSCATPGTPYDPKYGDAKSPDCGYEFKTGSAGEKNGVFSATVTMRWEVRVVVTGGPNPRTFTIPGINQSSAPFELRVAEMQVLN
ncbi:hypothetical protein [Streptomyces sp. CBMA156]|uniref:hypothetical protein n=1 Tax=Streptomyces sp. CBMA156 TaxID=1930280 RepID=UPI001661D9EF|nr:hypothetical protein [Streptomyces sp. CBMA156]MBD0671979.1 hypothetical protein [Streptomyces sp. CBMA156]